MEAAIFAFAPPPRIGWLDWLRREMAAVPGRDAMTVRIVVAVVLVIIISTTLQIPEMAFSAYLVFFVTKENKIVTTLTGVLSIVGATIGIAASLLVYRFTFDFPELRIPATAIVLFAGFFFSRVFVIGPLAFAIGFVIAITQTIAELMPSAEYLVHYLLWLWVAISYPIAITVVVNQFLLPAHPRTELERELQRRIDATTGLIDRKLGLTPENESDDDALQQLAASGAAGLFKLLKIAGIADPRIKRQHAAGTAAIMATGRLVSASAAFALRKHESLTPDDRRQLAALRDELAVLRTALAQPSVIPPKAEAGVATATLLEIRELQHASAMLRDSLKGEIAGSAVPAGPPSRKNLLAADAFTNPAHVHFALKVTLAAMTCYIVYTGLNWPGLHTAFITCCIISLESTGATLRKGALRIAGCVIGGLLGFLSIMYLIPFMESITSLVLLVAVVTAFAGWVASGSERISYAGLQIALAFNLTMFQGFAPAAGFEEIRDRLMGILLGISATAIVFHYIWPERASNKLKATLAGALRSLAKLVASPQPGMRKDDAVVQGQSLGSEVATKLEETIQLSEAIEFETDPMSGGQDFAQRSEALAVHERGIYLTAALLVNEDSLAQWQSLAEPAQRIESDLRTAIAKLLDRAAVMQTEGTQTESSELQDRYDTWNKIAPQWYSDASHEGRASLLRRLVEQVYIPVVTELK